MNKILNTLCGILLLSTLAFAQPGDCTIDPGDYCTRTQGGWGADCNGGNAGCILQNHFATVFPTGLTVGGTFTIHYTSSTDVRDFLPAGTQPNVLTQDYTDPTSNTTAGVFAGQVTALAINVAFGDAGIAGFNDFGMRLVDYGPFEGYSVDYIIALSNGFLGGYCTRDDCDMPGNECSTDGGAICIAFNGGQFNQCMKHCTPDGGQGGCRTNYVCEQLGLPDGGPAPDGICYPNCNNVQGWCGSATCLPSGLCQ